MGPNRFVHILFISAAIVAAFLLTKTGEWLIGYVVAKPPETLIAVGSVLVGSVAAFVAYRNDKVFELASEVTAELRKVAWPSRQETRAATVVVIVTVLVFAAILGLYDLFWSYTTTHLFYS